MPKKQDEKIQVNLGKFYDHLEDDLQILTEFVSGGVARCSSIKTFQEDLCLIKQKLEYLSISCDLMLSFSMKKPKK